MTASLLPPVNAIGATPPGRLPTAQSARLWIGVLIAGFLAILFWIETSNITPFPLAAVVALLALYAGLCALSLETAATVVLALTPFSVEIAFPGIGGALQIPTEPMLFLALAAWGLRFLLRRSTRLAHGAFAAALLVALAACLLSIVGATHRFAGIKAVASTAWYGLYGLFILNNFSSVHRGRVLVAATVIPALLVTIWSLGRVMAGSFDRAAGYWSAGPCFTEHGSFAAYLCFGFALLVALSLALQGAARLACWCGACLVGLQVFLSLTRGAWLGVAAFLVFVGVLNWRRLLRPTYIALLLFTLIAAGGLLAGTGLIRQLQQFTRTTSSAGYTSNLERVNRWYAGLRMFQSAPLTGIGWGTYPDEYARHRRFPAGTDQSAMRMGIHSEYFRVIVETGLIGGAAALVVVVMVVRMVQRAIRGAPDPIQRALAVGWSGGLLVYAVHAAVNNFMAYDKVAMPVWTAVGALAAAVTMQNRPRLDGSHH